MTESTKAFGKRIEDYICGLMLKEGLRVFRPMVDEDGVDAVVKKPDGTFAEIQIKGRAKGVQYPAMFATIKHEQERPGYWFVFYTEQFETIFLLSSAEFLEHSTGSADNKTIQFGHTEKGIDAIREDYTRFIVTDFTRIYKANPALEES